MCPGRMSSAQLLRVKDGDSIVVNLKGRETEVRLYGIDAPEFGQAYGEQSTKAFRKLLAAHEVGIKPVTTDQYGRTVAIVFADGKNICEAMVADGRAWVYTKYCTKSFCGKWRKDEENARKARLGLWKKDLPRPPWEWRKNKRRNAYDEKVLKMRSVGVVELYCFGHDVGDRSRRDIGQGFYWALPTRYGGRSKQCDC